MKELERTNLEVIVYDNVEITLGEVNADFLEDVSLQPAAEFSFSGTFLTVGAER